jgi:hypothetical protein
VQNPLGRADDEEPQDEDGKIIGDLMGASKIASHSTALFEARR